jgi:RHS repeat-associated protein
VTTQGNGATPQDVLRSTAFGEPRDPAPNLGTDRRFTGQRFDSSVNLYDYQARSYGQDLGRFIQPDTVIPDPTNPQALNRLRLTTGNGPL